jgi:hypothetical protein
MRWTIIATIASAAFVAVAGGLFYGLLALATMGWLLLVLRPSEAGLLVASLSRQRFD